MRGEDVNQKLTNLLSPRFGLYFLCLALFAGASAVMGDYYLALGELLVVLVLFLFFRRSNARRRREAEKYLERLAGKVDLAAKDTMLNCPLPVVMFQPDSDDVVWSNDRFLAISGAREHLFDTKLSAALPGFDARWLMEGKSECPEEVELSGRRYRVYGHLARTEDRSGHSGFLASTYWLEVTDLADIRESYVESRPVVAILLLDNFVDTI